MDSSPISCSRPPVRTLLPYPKGINGLFLSAEGTGSCGLGKKDEEAEVRGRVLGLGLSLFVLRELRILNGGIDMCWSAENCVCGILH